jgi:hypothetical protein
VKKPDSGAVIERIRRVTRESLVQLARPANPIRLMMKKPGQPLQGRPAFMI